jgi:hypothetical protein
MYIRTLKIVAFYPPILFMEFVYLVVARSVRKEIPALAFHLALCLRAGGFIYEQRGSIHLAFGNEGNERMRLSLSVCIQSAAQNWFAWTKKIVMNGFGLEQS